MHMPLFVLDTSENRPPRKRHRCDAPSDAYAWQGESRNPAPAAARPPGASTHMVLPLPLSNGRKISFQAFAGWCGVGGVRGRGQAGAEAGRQPAREEQARHPAHSHQIPFVDVRAVHPLSALALQPH